MSETCQFVSFDQRIETINIKLLKAMMQVLSFCCFCSEFLNAHLFLTHLVRFTLSLIFMIMFIFPFYM
jgi:hypothetical protein